VSKCRCPAPTPYHILSDLSAPPQTIHESTDRWFRATRAASAPRAKHPTKMDAYQPFLEGRPNIGKVGVWKAWVLFWGCDCAVKLASYTILKDWLQPFRPGWRQSCGETAPGTQMNVDSGIWMCGWRAKPFAGFRDHTELHSPDVGACDDGSEVENASASVRGSVLRRVWLGPDAKSSRPLRIARAGGLSASKRSTAYGLCYLTASPDEVLRHFGIWIMTNRPGSCQMVSSVMCH
jgi:hypothetical protein